MSAKKAGEYGKASTPNPAVSKYAGLSDGPASDPVTWEDVDGRAIKAAISATTADGCALIFSTTSDGGALSVTLLAGSQRHKKYAKSAPLAESLLLELVALARS